MQRITWHRLCQASVCSLMIGGFSACDDVVPNESVPTRAVVCDGDYQVAAGQPAAECSKVGKEEDDWGDLARHIAAGMDKDAQATLDPLFQTFSGIEFARNYMSNPVHDRQAAYREFLVRAALAAQDGDVGEAIFFNFLKAITPQYIFVKAITPEIEAGGRLEKWVRQDGLIVGNRQQEYPRAYDFYHFFNYLLTRPLQDVDNGTTQGQDGKPLAREGVESLWARRIAGSRALIEYMIRTDPGQALQVMISFRYSVPYPPNVTRRRKSNLRGNAKKLLFAQHVASDVMFCEEFGFEIEPERLERARQLLREIAGRDEWWIRLYVATVMSQSEALKDAEVLKRVRESAER